MLHGSIQFTRHFSSDVLDRLGRRVERVASVGRVAGRVGRVAVGALDVDAERRGLVLRGQLSPALRQVLAVRVLVEASLGHEQRGDGARRQAHGGRARRDAAAPALRARVVQHV